MAFLPIVGRELSVAARRKRTYRSRSGIAIMAAAAAAVFLVFAGSQSQTGTQGALLFRFLSQTSFYLCLLCGAFLTADCLSRERREGTLGLLFLTDLKGSDVVLGKLAGASLEACYGLLAMLPVLALALLLGGVSASHLALAALLLSNTLLFSLSAGLFASSLAANERTALMGAVGVVFLIALFPLFLPVSSTFFRGSPVL